MKVIIASDIHGSSYYCSQLLEAYRREGAEKLILLGDLLYHGPRNALPQDYETMETARLLNEKRDFIIAVHGNCDAEVDQMVLDFPITDEVAVIEINGRRLIATHGHKYSEYNTPPQLCEGDILLNGHFHVPACRGRDGFVYMNPGSVSIPKEGSQHSYILFDETGFYWKDLEGETYMEFR